MAITVTSREEAWNKVSEIFPTDYIKNERLSAQAGYDIYTSTAEGNDSWISDLNDRLEVNLESGSINIWIDGLKACYEAVVFEVEVLGENIFKAYGKALVRAKQDVFFNTRMIKAYEKYIENHNIKWND